MSTWLIGLLLSAAAIYLVAMQQDIFHRRIPNALSIALVVLGIIKWTVLHGFYPALWALAAAAIVFLVTLLMFSRGWMGGGDVKLLTSSSFFLGAGNTYPFVVYTAFAGGIVTLAVLGWRFASRRRHLATVGSGEAIESVATVPYGVAIAAGALCVMSQQLLLSLHTLPR